MDYKNTKFKDLPWLIKIGAFGLALAIVAVFLILCAALVIAGFKAIIFLWDWKV